MYIPIVEFCTFSMQYHLLKASRLEALSILSQANQGLTWNWLNSIFHRDLCFGSQPRPEAFHTQITWTVFYQYRLVPQNEYTLYWDRLSISRLDLEFVERRFCHWQIFVSLASGHKSDSKLGFVYTPQQNHFSWVINFEDFCKATHSPMILPLHEIIVCFHVVASSRVWFF